MERFGEWRAIEPVPDDNQPKPSSTEPVAKTGGGDLRFVGLLAAGVLATVGAFIWLTGSSSAGVTVPGNAAYFDSTPSPSGVPKEPTPELRSSVVVDVEGAVVSPGLQSLPAGSRVGDAIAAAGGYSPQVDIVAATAALNLAAPLTDGAKVHVPARGDVVGESAPPNMPGEQPAAVGDPGSGLIDLNTATADQLDTLPGIGPVTAAEIIAARQVAPFGSVDELLSREVVGPATFEKIRALVSVAP